MSPFSTFQIASAALHLLPTVVWSALAVVFWQFLFVERRRLPMHWLLPVICSLFAFHYALHVIEALTPRSVAGTSVLARIIPASIDVATVVGVPIFLHLLLYSRGERASRPFLAINYGLAAGFVAVAV